jgi:cyclin-dependent kinase-like
MNKYEILGVSGEGAYGVVLKCRNKETDDVGSFVFKKKLLLKNLRIQMKTKLLEKIHKEKLECLEC